MTKQIIQSTPARVYQHGASDWRVYPPATGGGGGGSPIVLPLYAGFYGDSNTSGRANSQLPAKSPHDVFMDIYLASGYPAFAQRPTPYGQSGQSLAETAAYVAGRNFLGRPWIHIEESGDQAEVGQTTPLEYGATFEQMWRDIHVRYPTALKTYPTSPNFGREDGYLARDWKTTLNWADWGYANQGAAISYNDEMKRRVQILAADGIEVLVIELAAAEDALAAVISGGAPTLYSDTQPFHWSPVGRLLQALTTFKRLGYNINTLDISGETVHTNPTTDAAYKAAVLTAVNSL